MAYGFRCYDASGRLTCDNTSIMSQVKGTRDLPFVNEGGGWVKSGGDNGSYKYTYVISNCDFSNGTPYVFFVPIARNVGSSWEQGYAIPDVILGANSITLEYNMYNLAFPDDTSYGVSGGGMTCIWGVYNG